MITQEQAKDLAVRYAAYLDAVARRDDAAIVCWGPMLLDTQKATGVEMVGTELTESLVKLTREKMAIVKANATAGGVTAA